MFCDETTIRVIAGKGGDGCIGFRREKYIPKGGPDGGDGGRGGNVILRANENINTLSDINSKKIYKAESGGKGMGANMSGRSGQDLYLDVPVGTVVFTTDKSKIICDLTTNHQEFIIGKGGKGGFGNQHFASSTNQAPKFAENGEPGEEKEVTLELKLVADVGLVGMPSVGKSTLISHISNARPKIADYEFTTLIPNLGVVDMPRFGGSRQENFVVEDIPGLIEGASKGRGLGHQFLKHITRTATLIHMIDPLRGEALLNFKKIQKELGIFDKSLLKKPTIVAINKIDAFDKKDIEKIEKAIQKEIKTKKFFSKKIHKISAVSGEGLKELIFDALKLVKEERTKRRIEERKESNKILKEIPILEPHKRLVKFEITDIKRYKSHKVFEVQGSRIEQVVAMTNIENPEGLERVYHFLDRMGIERAVRKEGALEGDIIIIAGKRIPYRN